MPKSQYFTWISSVSTNPIYASEIDASALIDMDNPYVFFCPLRILLIFPSQHRQTLFELFSRNMG